MGTIIQQFIENFVFTEGLSVSDIIGWSLTFLAGLIAFKLIDHLQTAMERHNMLSSIEDDFSKLYDMIVALYIPDLDTVPTSEDAANYSVMVRSVLHDNTPWHVIREDECSLECNILNNQRYIHIRNNKSEDKCYNEWIATQALHEITLKARRIEKMYKAGIIKRIDLADMFRELVPLGTSGRIEVLAEYYGKYDVDCLGYLVMQTVVSCHIHHNPDIVKYFADYYNSHEEIHDYFIKSCRIRPIRDAIAVMIFKKIMKENIG